MPKIVEKHVGSTGFGLMGLAPRSTHIAKSQAFRTLRAALEVGCNFWNAGEHYGTAEWNTQTLLAAYFKEYPEDAQKVVLSVKGAFNFEKMCPDGSPEGIKRSLDKILQDLDSTKKIDVFECARVDPNTPLDVTLAYLEQEYVSKGIISGIGLSEVGEASIRRAAKITKIVSVEVELSLWSTLVLENGVASACAELDIPVIAYSPLGQGILTGQIKSLDDIPKDDFRRHYPRFSPENFHINIQLANELKKLAVARGCTPAQLALSWLRYLSTKQHMPQIIPIPGATTESRVRENAQEHELTADELSKIDAILANFPIAGGRYPEGWPVEG